MYYKPCFLELSNNLANELGHHFVWVHTVSPQLLTQVYRAIYRTIGKKMLQASQKWPQKPQWFGALVRKSMGVESGPLGKQHSDIVMFGKSTVVCVSTAMLNCVELQESKSFPKLSKTVVLKPFCQYPHVDWKWVLSIFVFMYTQDGSSLKKGNTMRYPNVLSIGKTCFFLVFTVFVWFQRLNHWLVVYLPLWKILVNWDDENSQN